MPDVADDADDLTPRRFLLGRRQPGLMRCPSGSASPKYWRAKRSLTMTTLGAASLSASVNVAPAHERNMQRPEVPGLTIPKSALRRSDRRPLDAGLLKANRSNVKPLSGSGAVAAAAPLDAGQGAQFRQHVRRRTAICFRYGYRVSGKPEGGR